MPQQHATETLDSIPGNSEMGARIRAFDWQRSPLGPFKSWQQSLKTAVRMMLHSRFPMFIWWGPELINLYNDAYSPILGARHPQALGRPASEIWHEIWKDVGPLAHAVLHEEKSTWNERMLLVMERHGFLEETYFTFSYSPMPGDQGRAGGVFCACTEDTARVVGERRLQALRQLAGATAGARAAGEVCEIAARTLGEHGLDVAFALIYLLEDNGTTARLSGSTGLPPESALAPGSVKLGEGSGPGPWSMATALNGKSVVLRNLEFEKLPGGPWPEPCHTAVVLPLIEAGKERPTGFLVTGASPRRPFDDDYHGFLDLLAGSLASALSGARAHEEARQRLNALAELDRAKTVFFSNISHEFRTPLTLMLGPLADLIASDETGPGVRTELETAHRNGLRLLKLVNSLLDFSRIEAGRLQASYEPVDLARLTSDLASVFRSAIEKAGLTLTVVCPPLSQPAYVDREMWEKIVLNLLSNAFKFTREGEIHIRQTEEQGSVRLSVSDTGEGIPAEEIPEVFKRFHRVPGTRGRSNEGSGIGLAMVQELAKLHGGSVSLYSTSGYGSSFHVTVPLGKDHLPHSRVRETPAPQTSSFQTGSLEADVSGWLPGIADLSASSGPADGIGAMRAATGRIVLADDNRDMREYAQRILSQRFAVEAVPDGHAALDAVREQAPDLVLADVMMPRLDGLQFVRTLRADPQTKHIPVVLLSARAGEEAVEEAMGAGADDYVTKPFSGRELMARVSGHLAIARLQRESEDKLRRSQEQLARQVSDFETLLRELPVGIAVAMDPLCENIRTNPAFAQMLGIPEDTNASKSGPAAETLSFRMVSNGVELPPDKLPMQIAAREGREVRNFEAEIVRADGSVLHELGHAIPLFDENGEVRGSLAVFIDISERRRAEEALRESEQRFRHMAENAPVMIWVTDEAGRCTYINRQWLELTGTRFEDNLGLGWLDAVHPDDRAMAAGAFQMSIANATPLHIEYRLRRHDGQWRWAVDSAVPRLAEDGSFLGYIGSVIDITERKEMEHALRASEERLALAQNAAGVGSWDWRPGENSTSFSGEYFALHGLARDHPPISFDQWLSLIHPEDQERVRAAMEEALSHTASLDIEFRVPLEDGTFRWLAGKGTVFTDEAGAPVRFTGVNFDITDRKLAELELLRTNEDLKQFAYAASHDLQEPLRIVVNYTQLLASRYKDELDERAGMLIGVAVDSALRMERLLRGLRDYWQFSDRQALQIATLDLNEVVERAIGSLRNAIAESNAVVHYSGLPSVAAAETPLLQVFQNLISNAIKYRSPDRQPHIVITAESLRSEHVISVADNGIGIQPQYIQQIFGIFKRLHGTQFPGAGIGLAICQKAIERFGGRIWVESEYGRGSTFRFSLPYRVPKSSG